MLRNLVDVRCGHKTFKTDPPTEWVAQEVERALLRLV